jgi:hypothetical protein
MLPRSAPRPVAAREDRHRMSPRSAQPPLHRLARRQRSALLAAALALGAILIALVAVALVRGLTGKVDWIYWVQAAEAVQRDGLPPVWSMTYGYPPHVPLAWIVLTQWLPVPLGLLLYVAANAAAAVWIVRTVGREWTGLPPAEWPMTQLVPVLLVLAHAVNSFHHNQLSVLILFGVVLGVTLVQRGRPTAGGAVLGIVASVKLIPLCIVGLLLVKRCWRAAAAAIVAGLLALLLPCLAAYGVSGTQQALQDWAWRVHLMGPAMQTEHYPLLAPERSQALVSVLNRWLRPAPELERVDVVFEPAVEAPPRPVDTTLTPPTARIALHPPRSPELPATSFAPEPLRVPAIADVSAGMVAIVYGVAALGLVVLAIGVARRPLRHTPPTRLYAEMSLGLLVGVVVAPVMFAYYLVWAYPAWALLLAEADRRRRILLPALLIVAWLAAQVAMAWMPARQAGVNLLATLLLIGGLALLLPRSQRP